MPVSCYAALKTWRKCHIHLPCQTSILRIHFRFVSCTHSAVISTQIIALALFFVVPPLDLLSRMMCVQSDTRRLFSHSLVKVSIFYI